MKFSIFRHANIENFILQYAKKHMKFQKNINNRNIYICKYK